MTLNEAIERKGLSRKNLAIQVGIAYRTINSYIYKTRQPPPRIATRIGEVLGLSKEELWEMFYDKDHHQTG